MIGINESLSYEIFDWFLIYIPLVHKYCKNLLQQQQQIKNKMIDGEAVGWLFMRSNQCLPALL